MRVCRFWLLETMWRGRKDERKCGGTAGRAELAALIERALRNLEGKSWAGIGLGL